MLNNSVDPKRERLLSQLSISFYKARTWTVKIKKPFCTF